MATPLCIGFDADLTLIDTRERITVCQLRALRELGVAATRDELMPYLGVPLTMVAEAFGLAGGDCGRPESPSPAEEFVRRYRELYDRPDAPPAPAMPGARETLLHASAAGIRCVVVSAKLPGVAAGAVATAGLTELVAQVYGGVFASDKAAPLRGESAWMYVGDHPADMVAARSTPCVAVGVTTGVHDADVLQEAGADHVIADLHAFPPLLDRLLKDASTGPVEG